MKFYQINKTITRLGGIPFTETHFFKVWDNAHNHYNAIINDAIKGGYSLLNEEHGKGGMYVIYISNRTGTTIEVTVYDREFND